MSFASNPDVMDAEDTHQLEAAEEAAKKAKKDAKKAKKAKKDAKKKKNADKRPRSDEDDDDDDKKAEDDGPKKQKTTKNSTVDVDKEVWAAKLIGAEVNEKDKDTLPGLIKRFKPFFAIVQTINDKSKTKTAHSTGGVVDDICKEMADIRKSAQLRANGSERKTWSDVLKKMEEARTEVDGHKKEVATLGFVSSTFVPGALADVMARKESVLVFSNVLNADIAASYASNKDSCTSTFLDEDRKFDIARLSERDASIKSDYEFIKSLLSTPTIVDDTFKEDLRLQIHKDISV